MPFGLTGAPSSFQRLMDEVMRGLPFVSTYIDDVLIYSPDHATHRMHLQQVFQRLSEAGLTLRGRKCHIGMSSVSYLGHVFSGEGMLPDQQKIQAIQDWPTPHDVHTVRQFVGLASYYRCYIHKFADIVAPLHKLTQKGEIFEWNGQCSEAFGKLKGCLSSAPILAFPDFGKNASTFTVQTDASAIGLGAILEQDNKVIAYASQALTKSEKNYSVIQRECLAIVYALKQFRHYLLGRPFLLLTDHAPLQWLSNQKMEGLLSRWVLAMQEYEFSVQYRKGSLNTAADALSRRYNFDQCALTSVVNMENETLRQQQLTNPILKHIHAALTRSKQKLTTPEWKRQPLRRYQQLWHQLKLVEGIVCREYTPGPTEDQKVVPIYPATLRQEVLRRNHDAPSAGHLGPERHCSAFVRRLTGSTWHGMSPTIVSSV